MADLSLLFFKLLLDVFDKLSSTLEHSFLCCKPNAENPKLIELLEQVLSEHHIHICMRYRVLGKDIADKKLVDRQYLELLKYAEVVKPAKIKLSLQEKELFKAHFKVDWRMLCITREDLVDVKVGQIMNSKEAMEYLGMDKYGLDGICRRAEAITMKIRKGLYCTKIDKSCTRNARLQSKMEQPLFIINSFYSALRDKYTAPDAATTCFLLEWPVDRMSWQVINERYIFKNNFYVAFVYTYFFAFLRC